MTAREESLKKALEQIDMCVEGLAKCLVYHSFHNIFYRVARRQNALKDAVRKYVEIDKGQEYNEEIVNQLDEKYTHKAHMLAEGWKELFHTIKEEEKQEEQ